MFQAELLLSVLPLKTEHLTPEFNPPTIPLSDGEFDKQQRQQPQAEGKRVSIAAASPGYRRVSYAVGADRVPDGSVSGQAGTDAGARRRSSAINVSCCKEKGQGMNGLKGDLLCSATCHVFGGLSSTRGYTTTRN